jgi:hypothetical protein
MLANTLRNGTLALQIHRNPIHHPVPIHLRFTSPDGSAAPESSAREAPNRLELVAGTRGAAPSMADCFAAPLSRRSS